MEDLISSGDAAFITSGVTQQPYPLVIGPNGIPYLINIPGQGRRVKGELYRVSSRGMVRVDELEGTRVGHYERLPIRVERNAAEAYFADRAFGEKMWERIGEGLSEYTVRDGEGYVRKENRPPGSSFLGEIQLFLQPRS
ncbi:unnamed protein product [Linum tenue]|uniref:Gamma-glutamylcyclotransferase family protein n=1 Tax=Linum tenue TaxID=586396 RepID=A0AAV0M6J1_9ROSI|nr:unnamed protein product [Linum tenue]